MSLPYPSSGSTKPITLSAKEQEEWDAPLIALAQKSGGDLRRLSYAFFSFLHRRTDFYMVPNEFDVKENIPLKMGFKEGDAEKLLLASFRQFPLRRMPRMSTMNNNGKKNETSPTKSPTKTQPNTTTTTATNNNDVSKSGSSSIGIKMPISEKESEVTNNVSNNNNSTTTTTTKKDEVKNKQVKDDDDKDDDVRYSEDDKQIPVGNGGKSKSKGFRWTQTIYECSIILPVPEGTRGRDLKVTLKSQMIQVQLKDNKKVLLEGTLKQKIRPDESTWTLEGGVLVLALDKGAKSWWEVVFDDEKEEDRVDTTLIDTKRNISEYDDATQGMIRKILFDQRQERLGLPTSEEILEKKPQIPPLPPGVEYYDKRTNFPPDDFKK